MLSKATPSDKTLRATLVGTLIGGVDCCEKVIEERANYRELVADPAVYSRLDYQLDWIRQVIEGCQDKPICTIL